MAAVNSQMLALGTLAPMFSLSDTEGATVSLEDAAGSRAYLMMFICNHCPYVVHIADELASIGRDYGAKGVAVFAISANDVDKYPADSVDKMGAEKAKRGYPFPYLFDATQEVAKAYQASCTPDFYLFDAERKLVYRGQLDESRPNNGVPVTGEDLRAALDAVLSDREVPAEQTPSIGCNIKWKPGNAPAYFG